jgi:hypothetical protein
MISSLLSDSRKVNCFTVTPDKRQLVDVPTKVTPVP